MTQVERLKAARQHIVNGWCKGVFNDAQGNVCAVGAIKLVVSRHLDARLASNDYINDVIILDKALQLVVYNGPFKPSPMPIGRRVFTYNDAQETTKEDVLRIYDQAILLAKRST